MSLTKVPTGMIADNPAFSAYQSSAQTLAGSTLTQLNFQTEEFDANNCYDTATAAGQTGQMAMDGSFLYICTAPNTWKRVAIATW